MNPTLPHPSKSNALYDNKNKYWRRESIGPKETGFWVKRIKDFLNDQVNKLQKTASTKDMLFKKPRWWDMLHFMGTLRSRERIRACKKKRGEMSTRLWWSHRPAQLVGRGKERICYIINEISFPCLKHANHLGHFDMDPVSGYSSATIPRGC